VSLGTSARAAARRARSLTRGFPSHAPTWFACSSPTPAQRPSPSPASPQSPLPPPSSLSSSQRQASIVAAGKARAASRVKGRDARVLDPVRGPLDLVRGGCDELFAPDVAFSFPVWPGGGGRGRRALKLLVSSLAVQARCGSMAPRVEQLVVESPMPDLLVAKYVVSCCTLSEELQENFVDRDDVLADRPSADAPAVDKCDVVGKELYVPVRTELRVRSRIHFDCEGKIVAWHDTWDRAPLQFLREVVNFGEYYDELEELEGPVGLEPTANLRHNPPQTSKSDEDIENRPPHSPSLQSRGDSSQAWERDVAKIFDLDVYGEDGQLDSGLLTSCARALADNLPSSPVPGPDELRQRLNDIEHYLVFEVPKAQLPGEGPVDYSFFHEQAIFETPFVLSQGIDSLEFVHNAMRMDAMVRYSGISVKCIGLQHPSPQLLSATYLFTARNRLGHYVRRRQHCQFYLNRSGQIVHERETVDETTEVFATAFRRVGGRLWIW
jgi:hypothetical protein